VKNKILAIALFSLIITDSFGQGISQSNPDSLKLIWNNTSLNDTVRLKAMQALIFDHYFSPNPDSAIILTQIQMDYASTKGLTHFIGDAYMMQAAAYSRKEDYNKADELIYKGIAIATQNGDSIILGKCITLIGNGQMARGEFNNALRSYNQALSIHKATGNLRWQLYSIGNKSIVYHTIGLNANAKNNLIKALELNEVVQDRQTASYLPMQFGQAFLNEGDTIKAIEAFENGAKVSESEGFKQSLLESQLTLAYLFAKLNKLELSKEYLKRAEVTNQELKLTSQDSRFTEISAYQLLSETLFEKAALKFAMALNQLDTLAGTEKRIEITEMLLNLNMQLGNDKLTIKYAVELLSLKTQSKIETEIKQIQKEEFESKVMLDSLEFVKEKKLVEEDHQEEVRQKNQTRNMLAGGGILVLILAGGIYGRLRYTRKSKAVLQVEKDRSENLLLNILPADIAAELKEKGRADARDYKMASIVFTDFKGFTEASAKLSAQDLVSEINTCFEAFDGIMGKYNIEKIKTIGDAYMAAGGLPVPTKDSVKNTVLAALVMQDFISHRKAKLDAEGKPGFEMRVGIHTGPVVAGIVGVKKFQYDIWGDTVNTASRMESSGEVGQVNISEATYELLKDDAQLTFESRGKVVAKGKGEMKMYFVSKA
jgi:class 3 adenylate cyclase/tetratricopeptide (TPR) repeat protein